MKSIRKYEDGLNSKAGLAILNMGGDEKFPVFENLKEEQEYNNWNQKDVAKKQKAALDAAPLTNKYFAVIGVRWANIHDDYDYWHAAFTNLDDALQYVEHNKNNLESPRIFNEKAEQFDIKNFETEEETEL